MEFYSGCKNTFYITKYNKLYDSPQQARNICKDEVDGFIMVKTNPLTFHMYNKDGSIANMCGNGIRCFIHYCYNHNLIENKNNVVETLNGQYHTEIISTDPFYVNVNMVKPKYEYLDGKIHLNEKVTINKIDYNISLINTGVWHAVIITDNEETYKTYIKEVKNVFYSDFFKKSPNVNLVLLKDNKVYLKTFEYGVNDFTKACGTGSTATYLILNKLNIINSNSIDIIQEGGTLTISEKDNELYMMGPSERIK